MKQVTRQGDGGGRLRLTLDGDGDVHVAVTPPPGMSAVEFCTGVGGGRSPKVLRALRALIAALEQENKGPHPDLA